MSATVQAGIFEPAPVSTEQTLTSQELQQATVFLLQTQNGVIGATKGLSDAQWRYKPDPDRWSIAENLYHMAIVQERVLGMMERLAVAPAPPAGVDCHTVDGIVIHQFPDRLTKYQAPEFVQPAGEVAPSELVNRLMANSARLAGCLESVPGLRQHVLESLPLKAVSKGAYEFMDGYQWILAAAAHTERHTKQILEIKAEPGYPE